MINEPIQDSEWDSCRNDRCKSFSPPMSSLYLSSNEFALAYAMLMAHVQNRTQ